MLAPKVQGAGGGRRRGSPSLLLLGDPTPHEELESSYSLSEASCVKGAASIQASSPLPHLPKTVPVLAPEVPRTHGSQTDQESWLSHSQLACLHPPSEYGLGSDLKDPPVTYATWEPPRPAAAGSCLHFRALLQ